MGLGKEIPRITQNSKPRLEDGWIFSTTLGSYSYGMMNWVRDLVAFDDHGWMRLSWGC